MFLTLFFWLLIGVATAYFAQQRGRNAFVWFIIGILFGLLGLFLVFMLPIISEKEQELSEDPFEIKPEGMSTPLLVDKKQDFLIRDWFFLDAQHKQQGPISFDALKRLWQEQSIQERSFVWCEGMLNWQKIEELSDLKDALAGG